MNPELKKCRDHYDTLDSKMKQRATAQFLLKAIQIAEQSLGPITEADISNLTAEVATNFRSFGGGKVNRDNPLSIALAGHPAQFAAGVSVDEVVRFVLSALRPPQTRDS